MYYVQNHEKRGFTNIRHQKLLIKQWIYREANHVIVCFLLLHFFIFQKFLTFPIVVERFDYSLINSTLRFSALFTGVSFGATG
jgi:voltage-gated potassium channel Kch